MNSFFRKIKTLVTDKSLRNKVLFVVFDKIDWKIHKKVDKLLLNN